MIKPYDPYYGEPFQVIFLRPDNPTPTYEKGIVYQGIIIAARDGKTFSTKSVVTWAHLCGVDLDYAIVEGMGWSEITIN